MEGSYSSQKLRSRTGSFSEEDAEEEGSKGRGGKGRASVARHLLSLKATLGGLRAHKYAPIVAVAGSVLLLTLCLVLLSGNKHPRPHSGTSHSLSTDSRKDSTRDSSRDSGVRPGGAGSSSSSGSSSVSIRRSSSSSKSRSRSLSGGGGMWGRRRGSGESISLTPCSADGESMRPFIFVYDLGERYTADVRKQTPAWFSEVYDAEKTFLDYVLETSAVRTWDPEKALLFYVPFYAAYFLSCQFKDWENNMREAVMKTSEAWEAVLTQVRTEYPYFNRTNGADHFSVLSMDFARCQSLAYVEPRVYGDMFFLTLNGDKMLRSTHGHMKRNMQVLSYNYGAHIASDVPDIPCYRSDLDIVLPPTLEDQSKRPMAITSPFAGERTITVLFRFRVEHHHKQPVQHANHYIRKELFALYGRRIRTLEGWEFGVREPEKILREDLEKSLFCVCPPGHSQWSTRLTKAILAGCVPVTFFRDHENPWEEEIEYSLFSINIDPDAIGTLYERIQSVLRSPRKMLAMQRNLEKVQKLFAWDDSCPLGVQAHTTKVLWCRAKKLDGGHAGILRRESIASQQRSSRALGVKTGEKNHIQGRRRRLNSRS